MATSEKNPNVVTQQEADGSKPLAKQAKSDSKFTRVFIVAGTGIENDHPMHEGFKNVTLQEAIQRGFHPKGEPVHEGTEQQKGRRASSRVTYSVEVVPAGEDDDAGSTVSPSLRKNDK